MKKLAQNLLLYLIIFFTSLALLLYISEFFSVHNLKVEGVDDLKGIDKYSGSLMLILNEQKLAKELERNNPIIASISVYKQYPDTLYISARKLRPVVAVTLSDGFMELAEDGTVLSKHRSEKSTNLPTISFYQPLFFNQFTVGNVVDESSILSAAEFSDKLLDIGISASNIDISNENMIVLHTDNFSVSITSEENASKQFDEFSVVYQQLRIQGKQFTNIDVRFEKPIIKIEQ